jgi:hypothetical protein
MGLKAGRGYLHNLLVREGEPVSRILSWVTICLHRLLPAGSSNLPAEIRASHPLCCLVLLPARFTMTPSVAGGPVGSYPTVSPLPQLHEGSCGGLVSVALSLAPTEAGTAGRYPVPCSPESGLSSRHEVGR